MSAPAVARLSTPGEILAVLPSLCGFPPDESLVLLSLRGSRRRLGLTARVDLPEPPDEASVARLCAGRMAGDGADAVVLAVHSEQGRREDFVELVRRACEDLQLEVVEALHVQSGLWTSYSCERACCPPSGTPLPTAFPALGLVSAERVAAGRALLASRAELVASVAPPPLLQRAVAEQRLEQAREQWLRSRLEHGAVASRRSTLDHATALLDRVSSGATVGAADAALLAVGLQDVQARDGLATLLLTRSDELLSLLLQVARQVTPPADAPVCTLLAWVAYARGDGALANVALDRALEGTPDYSLALLLRTCLDAGTPPEQVRALARGTREALQRRRARRGRR
jgi:hypothetical protein